VEQAHGIRAAGHGDGDPIAGREHAMALDGLDHAVVQDDFIVPRSEVGCALAPSGLL
jgi:hypothetical protein